MKQIVLMTMIMLLACSVEAAELTEGKIYRLETTVVVTKDSCCASMPTYTAARSSKFIVSDSTGTDHYVVRFLSIKDAISTGGTVTSSVRDDQLYSLPKKIGATDTMKLVTETISGPISGPLVVPFKYRLNNRTLTGDATVGYYAGYSWSWSPYEQSISFSPVISAGLSQVAVANGTQTTNKSGFTWAAGFLIQNWANVNIGIVYGQDRIGDQTWESEGRGWVSVMVGWKMN
jgi:hypothetical protein